MIGKILQAKMEVLWSSGHEDNKTPEDHQAEDAETYRAVNITMVLLNDTRLDLKTTPDFQDSLEPGDFELFQGYPAPLLHFATACCVLFILLGIPGNLGTIVALYRCKKVRNATAVFIMNLSVSDLMFCCFNLPLAASTFYYRAWRHGALLCQLFPLMRYGLLAVSLFTVLAITINRYVMIGHPTLYPKLYRKQYLGLMVACTWVSGFGALIATWSGVWGRFGLDPEIGSCSILPDQHGNSPKAFLFLVAFVIPCISIVVCYARIFYIVRKTAFKSRPMPRCLAPASTASTTQSASKSKSSSCEDSAIGTSTTNASTDRSSSVYLDLKTSPAHFEREIQQNIYNAKTADNRYTIKAERVHFAEIKVAKKPSFMHKRTLSDSKLNVLEKRLLGKPRKSIEINQKKYYISSNPTSPVYTHPCHEEEEENEEEPPSKQFLQPPVIIRSSDELSTRSCSPDDSNKPMKKKRIPSVFGRNSSPRRPGHPQPGKMTAKDKKLLKMILVIFFNFLICYLPITLSKTLRHILQVDILNIAGYILIYLTTCMNPIIYVVMSSEYRQAYKNLLMCRSGDGSQQNRSNSQK